MLLVKRRKGARRRLRLAIYCLQSRKIPETVREERHLFIKHDGLKSASLESIRIYRRRGRELQCFKSLVVAETFFGNREYTLCRECYSANVASCGYPYSGGQDRRKIYVFEILTPSKRIVSQMTYMRSGKIGILKISMCERILFDVVGAGESQSAYF